MKQTLSSFLLLLILSGSLPLACLFLPQVQPAGGSPLPAEPLAETEWTGVPPLPEDAPAQEPTPAPTPRREGPLLIWDSGAQLLRTETVRDYLIGAVASEMPTSWPDEALKAQAVASHSWALYCRDHRDGGNSGAYFTACPQRREGYMTTEVLRSYWGENFQSNYDRIAALVDEVLTQIVTYEGQPAGTFYHAISSGTTADSANVWGQGLPYLAGVDSSADREAPDYEVQVVLGAQRVHDCLVSSLNLQPEGSPGTWLGQPEYDAAGYCTAIEAAGESVSGLRFRSALGLRSTAFSYTYDSSVGEFTFTTHGYGHGVGLSQWGAKALAEGGSSWQEILAHYFPGTALASTESGQ